MLALLPDPAAEAEYRRVLALDAARDAWRGGYQAGFLAAIEAVKRAQHAALADVGRWIVLCGQCRRNGRREDCQRCEVRTPGTFGLPHADDFRGGAR
jgi:hypothetical protein